MRAQTQGIRLKFAFLGKAAFFDRCHGQKLAHWWCQPLLMGAPGAAMRGAPDLSACRFAQRLIKIRDQVICVFGANRNAHNTGARAGGFLLFC